MKKIFGLILVLAACIGALYLLAPYVHPVQAPDTSPSGVEVTTQTVHEDTDAYTIDVQYPQVGIASIDAQIKKAVDDALAEFRSLPQNPQDSATPQNDFTGRFDKVYVGPDAVSAELILSEYTGGAHPMTIFSGVNFDRTTGKPLVLNDALKMTGLTIDQLSAQATAKLKAQLGDGFQFSEGANTNPENFSSFLIGTSSVTFIFQQYQVAAYVYGPQEVSFPKK
jgi:hypothetical protein